MPPMATSKAEQTSLLSFFDGALNGGSRGWAEKRQSTAVTKRKNDTSSTSGERGATQGMSRARVTWSATARVSDADAIIIDVDDSATENGQQGARGDGEGRAAAAAAVDTEGPQQRHDAMAFLMAKTRARARAKRVKALASTSTVRHQVTDVAMRVDQDAGPSAVVVPASCCRGSSIGEGGDAAVARLASARIDGGSEAMHDASRKPMELSRKRKRRKMAPAADQFHYGSQGPIHVRGDCQGSRASSSAPVGARESSFRRRGETDVLGRDAGEDSDSLADVIANAVARAHGDDVRFRPMLEQQWARLQCRGGGHHSQQQGEGSERKQEGPSCNGGTLLSDTSSVAAFAVNLFDGTGRAARAVGTSTSPASNVLAKSGDDVIYSEEGEGEVLCPGNISTMSVFTGYTIEKLLRWYSERANRRVASDELWTAVYRARCAKEVCGNNAGIYSLRNWLQEWRENIYKLDVCRSEGNEPTCSDSDYFQSHGGADTDDNNASNSLSERNLLFVSGEVGVSKTESVYACAEELGFEVIEVNASERRNGSNILNLVGEAAKSQNLVDEDAQLSKRAAAASLDKSGALENPNSDCGGRDTPAGRRRLTIILFDELETVTDDERGFSSAVQSISRSSRRPIILTSSKSHSPKCLSTSLSYSQIRFERQAMKDVCLHAVMCLLSQNVSVDLKCISLLSTVLHGDVRRILSHLQFWERPRSDAAAKSGERKSLVQAVGTAWSIAALKHVMPPEVGILYAFERWPRVLEGLHASTTAVGAVQTTHGNDNAAGDGRNAEARPADVLSRDRNALLDYLTSAASLSDVLSSHDAALYSLEERQECLCVEARARYSSQADFRLEEIASKCAEDDEIYGDACASDVSNVLPAWLSWDTANTGLETPSWSRLHWLAERRQKLAITGEITPRAHWMDVAATLAMNELALKLGGRRRRTITRSS